MGNNQSSQSPEDWGNESMANTLTRGKYGIYRNFLMLFVKISALSIMVWLRYGIGRKNITLGSLIWAIWLMFALLLIFGMGANGFLSVTLTIPFIIGMSVLGIAHIVEGTLNLQRRNAVARPSYDPGRSIIWIVLWPILRWIRLAPKKGERTKIYQLDEWRWVRFGDPLVVMMFGGQLIRMGYGAFGQYIEIAAICMFIHLQMMVNNYYEIVQSSWDAKDLGEGMQDNETSGKPLEKENRVVLEKMPKSRADYEKWNRGKN